MKSWRRSRLCGYFCAAAPLHKTAARGGAPRERRARKISRNFIPPPLPPPPQHKKKHDKTIFKAAAAVTVTLPCFLPPCSERGARRGGADGQREAQESAQTPDHLLQLPAGGAAEEVPVGAVPGPAGAGRVGGAAGPHADTGQTCWGWGVEGREGR